jgi:pyruvate kinase
VRHGIRAHLKGLGRDAKIIARSRTLPACEHRGHPGRHDGIMVAGGPGGLHPLAALPACKRGSWRSPLYHRKTVVVATQMWSP